MNINDLQSNFEKINTTFTNEFIETFEDDTELDMNDDYPVHSMKLKCFYNSVLTALENTQEQVIDYLKAKK